MKINKRVGLTIAAVTLGIVTVVSVGAVAMAGPRGERNGNGIGGPSEAVTGVLNMTREEIQAQRLEGKSLVEIAATKGVTAESLVDAILAEKQTLVQERVTAGTLTQDQATLMLQRMEENVTSAVNRTATGKPEWAGSNGTGMGLRGSGTGVCDGTGAGAGTGTGRQMGRGNR